MGALSRRRRSRAYVYQPVESREAFSERVSRRVVEGLVQDFGDVALAQFVATLDSVDPALLAQLPEIRHVGLCRPTESRFEFPRIRRPYAIRTYPYHRIHCAARRPFLHFLNQRRNAAEVFDIDDYLPVRRIG